MVGACQQNSGIFLVRGGGAGAGSGRDTGWGRGWAGRDSDDQITGAGSGKITGAGGGLGARCLRVPGLGRQRARSDIPAGAEAGQAAEPPGTG